MKRDSAFQVSTILGAVGQGGGRLLIAQGQVVEGADRGLFLEVANQWEQLLIAGVGQRQADEIPSGDCLALGKPAAKLRCWIIG